MPGRCRVFPRVFKRLVVWHRSRWLESSVEQATPAQTPLTLGTGGNATPRGGCRSSPWLQAPSWPPPTHGGLSYHLPSHLLPKALPVPSFPPFWQPHTNLPITSSCSHSGKRSIARWSLPSAVTVAALRKNEPIGDCAKQNGSSRSSWTVRKAPGRRHFEARSSKL